MLGVVTAFMSNCRKSSKVEAPGAAAVGRADLAVGAVPMRKSRSNGEVEEGEVDDAAGLAAALLLVEGAAKKLSNGSSLTLAATGAVVAFLPLSDSPFAARID